MKPTSLNIGVQENVHHSVREFAVFDCELESISRHRRGTQLNRKTCQECVGARVNFACCCQRKVIHEETTRQGDRQKESDDNRRGEE
jgi:hypothetical protein